MAQAAWDEPTGALHESVAQLANSGVPIGGMLAGAKAGSFIAAYAPHPVAKALLPVVGGLVGMFTGNTAIETGGIAQQKADDGTVTEDELGEARRQGAVKGGVITGVDALTMGANRFMFGAPGRAVERAVTDKLVEEGVDVANPLAVKAGLANKEFLKKVTPDAEQAFSRAMATSRRVKRGAGALGLESAGEGVGEYMGSTAAGLDASFTEAALESLLSIPQSVFETGVAKKLDSPGRFTVETARNLGAHFSEEEAGVLQTTDLPKGERVKAARSVAAKLKEETPGLSRVFMDHAMQRIGQGHVPDAGAEEGADGPAVASIQPDIDAAANEAATSPTNDTPQPTDGQKGAGNYKVGKFSWNGLQISIENSKYRLRVELAHFAFTLGFGDFLFVALKKSLD